MHLYIESLVEQKRAAYLYEAEQHRLGRLVEQDRRPVQGRTRTVSARILLAYGILFRASRASLLEDRDVA